MFGEVSKRGDVREVWLCNVDLYSRTYALLGSYVPPRITVPSSL
jgi:hypothetical protein